MKGSFLKRMVIAGLAAAVIGTGCNMLEPSVSEAKAVLNTFDFEPHRGGRDARPENTLYAYAYAMEMGATTIECDMQLTKDGRIVMSHNPILNHEITRDANGNYIPDGKYDIRRMTVPEIKQFDVGKINPSTDYYTAHGQTQLEMAAQIPTLEEVFDLINEYGDKKVMLNIETKSYADPSEGQAYQNNADPKKFVKTFNDIVKKYGMEDRVILQSFDWRTIVEMKKLNPNIATSALWSQQPSWGRGGEYLRPYEDGASPYLGGLDIDDFKGNPVEAAHAIGADVVSPYYMELSKEQVELAHSYGMKVVPWTVNSAEDMEMLLNMGVDGIISDKPWLLRSVLEKRGIKLNNPVVNAGSKYHTGVDYIDVKTHKVTGGMDAAY